MKKLAELLNLKNELGIKGKLQLDITESGSCYILEIGNYEWIEFKDKDIIQIAINDLKEELEEKKTENLKTIGYIEKRIA